MAKLFIHLIKRARGQLGITHALKQVSLNGSITSRVVFDNAGIEKEVRSDNTNFHSIIQLSNFGNGMPRPARRTSIPNENFIVRDDVHNALTSEWILVVVSDKLPLKHWLFSFQRWLVNVWGCLCNGTDNPALFTVCSIT